MYMKHLLTFILLIIVITTHAQTGEKNFIDQNYIEVTGKAEMEIVPDKIYLDIVISEKDSKNKIPLAEMEKAMTIKLKELNIDIAKWLTVNDLSSTIKQNIISKSDILLAKKYQLMVSDGATAGKVIIELEKIDISNITLNKVDHSKIEQYRKDVKINATKAAKEKAELLSGAVGQSIGKALYIQELENNFSPMLMSNRYIRQEKVMMDSSIPEEPVIDFEKIKLEYSVLIRFELK
jgi:uncharacterized protein